MQNILLSPIPLSELEMLIQNSVRKALQESYFQSTPNQPHDEPLTTIDAAKYLKLAVPTLYSLVSRKEIPFNKPVGNKRLYFQKHELDTWLKSGRKKTVSEIKAEAINSLSTKKRRG